MPKKYTVSETALRRLVKQMVSEELEKQRKERPEGPFIDDFQEEPWFQFGEPEPAPEQKLTRSTRQQRFQQEFPGWIEPFQPESDQMDAPPFLNRQPKKK